MSMGFADFGLLGYSEREFPNSGMFGNSLKIRMQEED